MTTRPPSIEDHPDYRQPGITYVGGQCMACEAGEADEWHPVASAGLRYDLSDTVCGYACSDCLDHPAIGKPLAHRPARVPPVSELLAERRIER